MTPDRRARDLRIAFVGQSVYFRDPDGHTLALMQEQMLRIAGPQWLTGGLLQRVRFRAPVRPGEAYVLIATPIEGRKDAWRLELRDEGGEVLAAEAEAELADEDAWSD